MHRCAILGLLGFTSVAVPAEGQLLRELIDLEVAARIREEGTRRSEVEMLAGI